MRARVERYSQISLLMSSAACSAHLSSRSTCLCACAHTDDMITCRKAIINPSCNVGDIGQTQRLSQVVDRMLEMLPYFTCLSVRFRLVSHSDIACYKVQIDAFNRHSICQILTSSTLIHACLCQVVVILIVQCACYCHKLCHSVNCRWQ